MIINNKGGYIRHIAGVMIVPGENVLNPTDTDAVKAFFNANKKFAQALVPDELEYVTNEKEGIAAISTTKLRSILPEINSISDLEALLDEENAQETPRSTVIAAVSKRIEDLKAQLNQQKDNDDE